MGLRSKSLLGFFWTALGSAGNGLFNFVITIILARLLTPHDFALIEIVTIFILISNIFVDSGFSQAIIREKYVSQVDLSSVFFFSVIFSFLLFCILYELSPVIASFFQDRMLLPLSRCAFTVIILNSFSIIHVALLSRALEFKKISISSLCAVVISGIIAVVYALTIGDVWALLINLVLYPFFRILFLWISTKWFPSLVFSWKSIKKFFKFSSFLLIVEIVDMIITHSISIIIGKSYSKEELGLYSQGKKIDNYVITPLVGAISRVTYPVISQIKDEQSRFVEGCNSVIKVMAYVMWPIAFFEIITADNLSLFLFGPQWEGTGFYIRLYALWGVFYPLQAVCINVLLSKGKTKQYMYLSFIRQILRVVSLLLFINYGVKYMAMAFILSGILGTIFIILYGLLEIGVSKVLFRTLNQLIFPLLCSIFVISLLDLLLDSILVNNIIFFIQVISMILIYVGLSYVLKVDALSEILTMMRSEISNLKIHL